MPDRCSATDCTNSKVNCPNLSFFRFPKDLERCMIWSRYAGRELLDPVYMNNNLRLCSVHFSDDQFSNSIRSRLMSHAVPDVQATKSRTETFDVASTLSAASMNRMVFPSDQTALQNNQLEPEEPSPAKRARNSCSLNGKKSTASTMVQTDPTCITGLLTIDSRVEKLEDKVKRLESAVSELVALNHDLRCKLAEQNDTETFPKQAGKFGVKWLLSSHISGLFHHHTGFSYRTFCEIFHVMVPSNSLSNPIDYTVAAIPYVGLLTLEDQLLLTLMRLRKNDSLEDLALRFGIPACSVGALFESWVGHMFVQFRSLSVWPHRDSIIQNMPADFSHDFPTTLAVVDHFKVVVAEARGNSAQNPNDQSNNSQCTLTGLIVLAPTGSIMFASTLCAKAILPAQLLQASGLSGLLQKLMEDKKLREGDSIMVLKDFDVHSELEEMGLKLCVAPPPTALANITSQTPTTHRIQIEQTIARIKSFQILSGVIPHELQKSVDKIWFVCVHLSNFQDQEMRDS